ncbi:MAG: hypothetical protein KatS3mg085_498 [Candidatus Dojkabacteria bacterium]|nr:MAG: hypothetical protein KatS3mg085_498 [Candidatus Dojkabacteria bacterium]
MRKWTVWEINFLLEFGFDPFELAQSVDENIPVEYIVGKAKFYDYVFNVSTDTLIPRVETEEIIPNTIGYTTRRNLKKLNFIDIGCGCGNIGIALALELQKLNIEFSGTLIDMSPKALKVAKNNLKKFNLKLDLKRQDLKKLKIKSDVDIVIANLPYIPTSRISTLPPSVKNFEPITALDGGDDGLELVKILIRKIINHGNISFAMLEVDDSHDKIPDEFMDNFKTLRDANGKVRFWLMEKG